MGQRWDYTPSVSMLHYRGWWTHPLCETMYMIVHKQTQTQTRSRQLNY